MKKILSGGNWFSKSIALIYVAVIFLSCNSQKKQADLVVYNGIIYTADSKFSTATSFAVRDGKIIEVCKNSLVDQYNTKTALDLQGSAVFPGFHDGHCHFYGYGVDLKKISLLGTTSFKAITDTLIKYKNQKTSGWIIGRGWDQNDWDVKQYPNCEILDSLFPETPVFLLRIDGHAALVNKTALKLAGIDSRTIIQGGQILIFNGKPTGVLIDNAMEVVQKIIPKPATEEKIAALIAAQKACFAVGLTMVTDAGIDGQGLTIGIINLIDSLQTSNSLKMRVNAMASVEELDYYRNKGAIHKPYLNVSGFKLYADGALGSRGAMLKKPYSDQPETSGLFLTNPAKLDSLASNISKIGFQMNTHCIGDSSTRLVLELYAKYLSENKNARWRIEHAQIVDPNDMHYFQQLGVIPSIQPTHATSDMYWAEDRLGKDRMRGAYAYHDLMESAGILIGGSDFPVEDINPLYGIYAAVSRKDKKGYPENGFLPDNKISREDAVRSMTIWPAYGAYMENETGSLEKGKNADFVVLDNDIMKSPEEKIWQTKVLSTYIGGIKVFGRER